MNDEPTSPKRCLVCGGLLRKDNRYGICVTTPQCRRHRYHRYYEENRESLITYRHNYYKQNRETIATKHRRYREQNSEAIRARIRRYRQENRELVLVQKRRYYERHREALVARARGHYEQNREIILARRRESYAEKREKIRLQDTLRRRCQDMSNITTLRGSHSPRWCGGKYCLCQWCGKAIGWRNPSRLRQYRFGPFCKEHAQMWRYLKNGRDDKTKNV